MYCNSPRLYRSGRDIAVAVAVAAAAAETVDVAVSAAAVPVVEKGDCFVERVGVVTEAERTTVVVVGVS